MKCYRHLRDDALYDCAVCGRPICGECMRFTDVDDQITCPACDPKSAVSLGEVAAEEYDAYQDQVAQAADRGPSLRDRLSIRLNPFLVLLIFLFAGLYFYFDREIEKSLPPPGYGDERIMENGQPVGQFTYLLTQILRYRADRKRWPDTLEDLVPDYLDGPPRVLKSKDEFVYAKDMDRGFVLSLPNATRFRFLKMYATGDGIMRIE